MFTGPDVRAQQNSSHESHAGEDPPEGAAQGDTIEPEDVDARDLDPEGLAAEELDARDLDPDELEALLVGLRARGDGAWRPVDFAARASRLARAEAARLDGVFRSLARRLAFELGGLTGVTLRVVASAPSATRATSFLRSCAAGAHVYSLDVGRVSERASERAVFQGGDPHAGDSRRHGEASPSTCVLLALEPALVAFTLARVLGTGEQDFAAPEPTAAHVGRLAGESAPGESDSAAGWSGLERGLLGAVVARIAGALEDAWTRGAPPETCGDSPSFGSRILRQSEPTRPRTLAALVSRSAVAVVRLEVHRTDLAPGAGSAKSPASSSRGVTAVDPLPGLVGELAVAIPFGALLSFLTHPARDRVAGGLLDVDVPDASDPESSLDRDASSVPECRPDDVDASGRALRARLGSIQVEMTRSLETAPFALLNLLGLRPGDLIDTGRSLQAALDLRIESVSRRAPTSS